MNTTASKITQLIEAVEQLNQKVLFGGGIVLLVLLPFFIARFLLEWTLTSVPLFLHWLVLAILFGFLFLWAWLISGHRVHSFFASSYAHGIKWPLLYSVALLVFSLPCFAVLTVTLSRLGNVTFDPAIPGGGGAVSMVQDFYLWHFMDSVPGLGIPKTLRWDSPFTYRDTLSGWILLAFKLTVIVPVIGSFAVWNDIRKEQRKHEKEAA